MSKNPRIQVYCSRQDYDYLAKVREETGESNSQIIKRILHFYKWQNSIITNHIVIPGKSCKTCFNKFNDACKKCEKVMHKYEYVNK